MYSFISLPIKGSLFFVELFPQVNFHQTGNRSVESLDRISESLNTINSIKNMFNDYSTYYKSMISICNPTASLDVIEHKIKYTEENFRAKLQLPNGTRN